jgi:hypothetical protein
VVREGVGAGGEMTQALYAHMNNKTIKKKVNAKDRRVKKNKINKKNYFSQLLKKKKRLNWEDSFS